eukprot:6492497-Amphidinium_carterae.1
MTAWGENEVEQSAPKVKSLPHPHPKAQPKGGGNKSGTEKAGSTLQHPVTGAQVWSTSANCVCPAARSCMPAAGCSLA